MKTYLAGGAAVGAGAPSPAAPKATAAVPDEQPAAGSSAATPTPHTAKGTGSGESAPTPLPAGQVLPASQIKGTMTLRDVSQQCGVPFDKMLAAAKLPAGTNPEIQVKSLKDVVAGYEVRC